MKELFFFLSGLALLSPGYLAAQEKQVDTDSQVWTAAFGNIRFSDANSLFVDLHYVGHSFAVTRAGIVYHLSNDIAATAGFARLWLTVPGSGHDRLERHEHRPWAQVFVRSPLPGNFSMTHRLRYDLRFRERVANGEVRQGYNFNHRLRLQETVQLNLPWLKLGKVTPYVVLADEVLLNFGEEVVYNTFDQNRLSLMVGGQLRSIRLQTGYMNRFVQSAAAPGRYSNIHTLVIWLFYNLDIRRQESS